MNGGPGMGIPAGVTRVSLLGTLATTEIFDTSFWFSGVTAASADDATAQATEIAGYVNTRLTAAVKTLLNGDSSFDRVRCYAYPTGGPTATYVGEFAIASGVGTGSSQLPLQAAYCVTLETGLSGRSNRGRMYLPFDAITLQPGHLVSTANRDTITDFIGNVIKDVNSSATVGIGCVVSQVGSTFHSIVNVRGDQRIDTQRRRANRQSRGTTHSFDVVV